MPITKAEFDEGKKKIFTDAIADKVGVLKRQVVVTGVSAHGAAAASLRRRRLLGAAAAGTGIDVQLLVEDLPMAKAHPRRWEINDALSHPMWTSPIYYLPHRKLIEVWAARQLPYTRPSQRTW